MSLKIKAKSHKREAKFRFGEYIHSFSIVVMKHRDQGLLEKRELCVLMVPEGGKPVRELRQQVAGSRHIRGAAESSCLRPQAGSKESELGWQETFES